MIEQGYGGDQHCYRFCAERGPKSSSGCTGTNQTRRNCCCRGVYAVSRFFDVVLCSRIPRPPRHSRAACPCTNTCQPRSELLSLTFCLGGGGRGGGGGGHKLSNIIGGGGNIEIYPARSLDSLPLERKPDDSSRHQMLSQVIYAGIRVGVNLLPHEYFPGSLLDRFPSQRDLWLGVLAHQSELPAGLPRIRSVAQYLNGCISGPEQKWSDD